MQWVAEDLNVVRWIGLLGARGCWLGLTLIQHADVDPDADTDEVDVEGHAPER